MEKLTRMELALGEDGRILCAGDIDYRFKSFGGALRFHSETAQAVFVNDCRAAMNSSDVGEGEKYSSGSTNFIREWWTLYLENYDDVGFHWDRDYGLEDDFEARVHPHLATVTYLSDVGGPTVVLDVPGNVPPSEFNTQQISSCIISKPVVGKHIVFDGLLLHGAPAEVHTTGDSSDEECSSSDGDDVISSTSESIHVIKSPRVTFLVNIWLNHVPIQSNTELSDSVLVNLSKDCEVQIDFSNECRPVQLTTADSATDTETAKWSLTEDDMTYCIAIPLPISESLEASGGVGVVKVDCSARPGGIKPIEDDSGEDSDDSSGEINSNSAGCMKVDGVDELAVSGVDNKPTAKRQRIG